MGTTSPGQVPKEPDRSARKHGLSLSARLPPWASKVRVMVAPVLVAFLCFIFVTVSDLNKLAGPYAFLCYTSVVLFYFPRGRVSQQIESNTINFVAATTGLAFTSAAVAVAGWCGRHYGRDARQARAVLGVALAILSLICGVLRSRAPRLNVACRAAMFYSIFVLTSQQTTTGFHASDFLNPFFVSLFAYAFSTSVGVILSEHSSSTHLAEQILSTVQITCDLLPMSLATILDAHGEALGDRDEHSSSATPPSVQTPRSEKELEEQTPEPSPWTKQQTLARQLKAKVAAIRSAHTAYTLDIVRARQDPHELLPIIRVLGRLQRNAILGPTGHVPGDRIRTALERTYASSRRTSRAGTPFSRTSSRVSSPRSRSPDSHMRGRSRPRSHLGSAHGHISATQLTNQLSKVATHARDRSRGGAHRFSSTPAAYPSPARAKLIQTCKGLSDAITAALNFAAEDIGISCDWLHEPTPDAGTKSATGSSGNSKPPTVASIKSKLRSALADLEKRLSGIIDAGDFGSGPATPGGYGPSIPATPTIPIPPRSVVFEDQMTSADWLDDEDRFRIAFYMIALLDLAKDVSTLLNYAVHLRAESAGKPKRWILPSIIWPWSKVTPEMPNVQTVAGELPPEQEPDINEDNHEDLDFVHSILHQEARPRPHGPDRDVKARVTAAWRSIWDRRGVVFARVAISKALHELKHSRHVHFALKQTIGISLLSLPAFLPLGAPGRTWYDSSRGPWMVVSFMYVIEVTTGATMRIGFYRMLGTFIGAVVGYICVLIARQNPYGLVALATACSVPITYVILLTDIAPLGIITGITLSPIVFIEYLHLDDGTTSFHLAWMRFVDIVIGIAAAILIGSWLWPIHARVRYFLAVADTMDQITDYYLRMSRDLLRPELVYHGNSKQYRKVEAAVRRQITRSRTLVAIQKQEISLLPRPIKLYSEVIDLMERLLETFTEVRTLRFSLPRKATVLDVLPIRRELVSTILVNLWATAQAFRSRSPLPQLLPSPRIPLGEVMEATDEHAHAVRARRARTNLRRRWPRQDDDDEDEFDHDTRDGNDTDDEPEVNGVHAELAVLYGMAENEALGEAITSIDEILAAARTLFGTQSFLDVNVNM